MGNGNMLFGVSTSCLFGEMELEKLLCFEPELIEFYNYPTSALPTIQRFCSEHHSAIGLHTPLPYDESAPLSRFVSTGTDEAAIQQAVDFTVRTIQTAQELNAEYVVVHFPSPYPEIEPFPSNEQIDRFFAPIAEAADLAKQTIVVENLSSHPSFYLPEHYLVVFERYPTIQLCLDVGHAHLLWPTTDLKQFLSVLRDQIATCHFYNTSLLRWGQYWHEPPSPEQSPEAGFIDLQDLAQSLRELPNLRAINLEIQRCKTQDEFERAAAGWSWFREIYARK